VLKEQQQLLQLQGILTTTSNNNGVGQKAPIVDHCKTNTSTQPCQNKSQPTPWGKKIVITKNEKLMEPSMGSKHNYSCSELQ
jgi:hypothetical protein